MQNIVIVYINLAGTKRFRTTGRPYIFQFCLWLCEARVLKLLEVLLSTISDAIISLANTRANRTLPKDLCILSVNMFGGAGGLYMSFRRLWEMQLLPVCSQLSTQQASQMPMKKICGRIHAGLLKRFESGEGSHLWCFPCFAAAQLLAFCARWRHPSPASHKRSLLGS